MCVPFIIGLDVVADMPAKQGKLRKRTIRLYRLHDGRAAVQRAVGSGDDRRTAAAVKAARRLRRANPKMGERLSFREISARLAEAGHLNEGHGIRRA